MYKNMSDRAFSVSTVCSTDVVEFKAPCDFAELIKSSSRIHETYLFLFEESLLTYRSSCPDKLSFANIYSPKYRLNPRSAGIIMRYDNLKAFKRLTDSIGTTTVKEIIDSCFFEIIDILETFTCRTVAFLVSDDNNKTPSGASRILASEDVGEEIVDYVTEKIWKLKTRYCSDWY